jgi:hypothetical protein
VRRFAAAAHICCNVAQADARIVSAALRRQLQTHYQVNAVVSKPRVI